MNGAQSLFLALAEDLQTNFLDIGPVNKVLNMISAYHGTCSDDIDNVGELTSFH